MSDITKEQVVDFISNMTVLELSQFIKELEEKFGVSAAAPAMGMMMAAPAAGGAAAPAEEEKTEVAVVLTGSGATKHGVRKVVRALTGLGSRSQGQGRRAALHHQGRRVQGRGRGCKKAVGRVRSHLRNQVTCFLFPLLTRKSAPSPTGRGRSFSLFCRLTTLFSSGRTPDADGTKQTRRDTRPARPMMGESVARLPSNVVALQQRKKWPS
jgi:ribosomal protein L7/L12